MEYVHPSNTENVEVFGLAVIFGFTLLSGNILLIALAAFLIAMFHHHRSPPVREEHEFSL